MTGTFVALFWCHCVNFSLSFYYSIILKGSMAFFSGKHCTLPTTLKMSEIKNQLLHIPTYYMQTNVLKMSCGKRWKWHFRDPKFKTFLGEHIYTSASPHLRTQTCLTTSIHKRASPDLYTNVPQPHLHKLASKNNKSRNVFNQYNRCRFLYSGKPASFTPRNKTFPEIFLIFIRIYFKSP